MAELNLDGLRGQLPPDAIIWRGDGTDWLVNLSQLSEDVLAPDSSFAPPLAELLQAVVRLVQQVNEVRASENPPRPPIPFIQKTISTSPRGNPIHEFVIKLEEKPSFSEFVEPGD